MSNPKPSIDFGYPTEAHGRIPSFNNIEEEAEWWDTHDISELIGPERQPVEVDVGPELAGRLTIRLGQANREELQRRAKSQGIGPSTLARMWIKERLQQEHEAGAAKRAS